METFCKTIGARNDVWKATTAEVCEYTTAMKKLNMKNNILYNPSDTDVYVIANGENIKIEAGSFADFN